MSIGETDLGFWSMDKDDFNRRPHAGRGAGAPEDIFVQVGSATSAWEDIESELANLFDMLVSGPQSKRAAFAAFAMQTGSAARGDLLAGALKYGLGDGLEDLKAELGEFLAMVRHGRDRRNDIAHGRVYKLNEAEFYLAPNNATAARWKAGSAAYQWNDEDVEHYVKAFVILADRTRQLVAKVEGAVG